MLHETEWQFVCAHLDFLEKLSGDETERLARALSRASFRKGVRLGSRNSDCLGVLLVHTGSLRVYIQSEDGREVTLYRLGSGEVCILSASCILNNLNFDVSIEADQDAEVFRINPGVFEELMRRNIWVENFSLRSAVSRFSDVMWAIEQVLFMRFDARLAIFLLDESAAARSDEIPATHDQIAKYVGSAREVVSRMLKQFESKGFVELSRGSIRIRDRESLKKLV